MLHPNFVAECNAAGEYEVREDSIAPEDSTFAEKVLETVGDAVKEECPLCMDVMQTPMLIANCKHSWYAWRSVAAGH